MGLPPKFDRSDFYGTCSCLLLSGVGGVGVGGGNLDTRATEEQLWKSRNWVGSHGGTV